MHVSEFMAREVEFITSDAMVRDAAVLMGELDVGALPVGTADHLEGVITDRDILYRVVARGLDCARTRLAEIISRPAITCHTQDTVQAALDLMASNQFRRLPVQDETGRVVGWITLGDVSRRLLLEGGALRAALLAATEPPAETQPLTAEIGG